MYSSGRARLVVLGAEMGGPWSQETVDFLSSLAWAKVRDLPEELQKDARRAWFRRWCVLLGCAAANFRHVPVGPQPVRCRWSDPVSARSRDGRYG